MNIELWFVLVPLFAMAALVYSMAGFGGGSAYLAILALFSFPYQSMPKLALLCNLIVSSGGVYFFAKQRHLSLRKILPFVTTSAPAAYLCGRLSLDPLVFSVMLAVSLGAAGIWIARPKRPFEPSRQVGWREAWLVGLPLGALLGAAAGLVGIGGGVFLAPVLFLLGWAHAKEAAAAASLFILVNSLAGFLGQLSKGLFAVELEHLLILGLTVLIAGQIGSRLGSGRLSKVVVQRVTAGLLISVSAKLILALV